MSFLKSLFGGGKPEKETPAVSVEYEGFTIEAAPFAVEGGQFQTAGTITKSVGGEVKSHRFIRADRFPSRDVAAEFSVRKARQIIDERREKIFD